MAADYQTLQMATFSAILFASPCLGPYVVPLFSATPATDLVDVCSLVGGWIVVRTSYRWMWIVDTIFSAVVTVVAYFCLVETCVSFLVLPVVASLTLSFVQLPPRPPPLARHAAS